MTPDEIKELTPTPEPEYGITHSTECVHYWILDGVADEQTGLTSVRCDNCWSGISVNSSEQTIKDGRLIHI